MKILIQRVKESRVEVDGEIIGSIERGLLLFIGISRDDRLEDVPLMASKVIHLRLFEDANGKMNHSIRDVGGAILLVSQFTLYGDTSHGRRPSFISAANPIIAERLYDAFKEALIHHDIPVETGRFGSDMQVYIQNDGPVTIMLDTDRS